jgi:hypothetical protein
LPRHIKWRKLRDNENKETFCKSLLKRFGKKWFVATKVPDQYDGLKAGDTVAMILGGSGDRLSFALSRRGEDIGARIFRIPAFQLKCRRKAESKDDDAVLLANLVQSNPDFFYLTRPRDRSIILVIEHFRARMETMKARIACEQRIFSNLTGGIFCREDGNFPEGGIEEMFNEAKANDQILGALVKEENKRMAELDAALEALDIYQQLFKNLDGVGSAIAGRLIAAIQDIRRFPTDSQLKAFCGVHVLPDGRFPRRRNGEVANWQPDARQALYLLGDQFNRRPNSEWGKRLRGYKVALRQKHPEVVSAEGKKRYGDGHIHKMALWRTLTKFVEWLHREWWKLERMPQ